MLLYIDLYIHRALALVLLVVMMTLTMPCAIAQSSQTPGYSEDLANDPLLYEPIDPGRKADVGGIGCLVGTIGVSAGMIYLMGGIGPTIASMSPPLYPGVVLEGSAAVSFVLSSVCYLGVILAPLAVDAYAVISESVETPDRPLFAPGELRAMVDGL